MCMQRRATARSALLGHRRCEGTCPQSRTVSPGPLSFCSQARLEKTRLAAERHVTRCVAVRERRFATMPHPYTPLGIVLECSLGAYQRTEDRLYRLLSPNIPFLFRPTRVQGGFPQDDSWHHERIAPSIMVAAIGLGTGSEFLGPPQQPLSITLAVIHARSRAQKL